jgi:Fungal N-terminal domain of STAND proteins
MADPVGLTASIIAVAGLAYQSGKTLYELLNGIQNAPRTLQALNEDLSAIQHLLKSIKSAMEDSSDNSFSNGVKQCLEEAKPALTGCGKACDEFAEKIGKIMSHSDENRTSTRDRIKLQFQEKDILAFRYRIGSYKATLKIALGLASL